MRLLHDEFEKSRSKYSDLKATTERSVLSFEYATGPYYELNPLYHKLNGIPQGRKLREVPTSMEGIYEFGLDEQRNVILIRQYNKFGFYETFLIYREESVSSYRYDYSEDKEPVNVRRATYDEGKLVKLVSDAQYGSTIQEFIYSGERIVRVDQIHWDKKQEESIRYFEVDYNEKNKVNKITLVAPKNTSVPYTRVVYKNYKAVDKLEQQYIKNVSNLIYKSLSDYSNLNQVYCICIGFDLSSTSIFQPSIGIGYFDQQQPSMNSQKEYSVDIWNPAEFDVFYSISNQFTNALSDTSQSLHSFVIEQEQEFRVQRIMNRICIELINMNVCEQLNCADSFVVYATSLEIDNVEKRIREVNPTDVIDQLISDNLL